MIDLPVLSESILTFLCIHADGMLVSDEQESIEFLKTHSLVEKTGEAMGMDIYTLTEEGIRLSRAIKEAGITCS